MQYPPNPYGNPGPNDQTTSSGQPMYPYPQQPTLPPRPPQSRGDGFDGWLKRQPLRTKLLIFGPAFLVFFCLVVLPAISIVAANQGNTATPTSVVDQGQIDLTLISQSPPMPTPVPPTPTPTPQIQPTPTPAPTSPPVPSCDGTTVDGICYDESANGGSLVYQPAPDFCTSFACVSTFWVDTAGYVVECGDGKYSHSGGVSGACSRNGGVLATVYSH